MNQDITGEVTINLQADLDNAKQYIQQGQLERAVTLLDNVLEHEPSSIDALYLAAVVQRYLNQPANALDLLKKLINIDTMYGRAYQEQGHIYKKAGDHTAAVLAFECAVKYNPALLASWRELVALYKQRGDQQAYQLCQSEYSRLSKIPAELISVNSLIHEEKLYQAEQLCRTFLKKHPHNIEAMRLLAVLGMKLFVYDDADFLLESCVEFDPKHWLSRHDYVTVLHKRQKYEKALEHATILRDTYPGNIAFDISYANQNVALGEFETALAVYNDIIAKQPQLEVPYLVRGHALKTIGRLDESIASYQGAYTAKVDFGDAYWSLANLKTYRFSDKEIEQMQQQAEKSTTALVDKFHLYFALGKAFEDRKDFAKSFFYYEKGNQQKKTQLRYRSEIFDKAMQRQIEVFDKAFFSERTDKASDYCDPIFIVGLPRAGSTLLEQILASHSQVDGTMELPNIIALSHHLNGRQFVTDTPQYPKVMRELTQQQLKVFADEFIRDTQCHRKGGAYFIDKMPNNFMHIGLIHSILPNAKIIDARRHPMACCFSGFKQLFADGQEFTYGLQEIARYYKGYVNLMDHWDHVLPGKVLRVHYEHVVADLDTQVARILDFCGLPFEPNCINFYQTERSVRTPSSEQVRQPIYQQGLDQWRNFEPFLGSLSDALGPLVNEYPASQ